MHPVFLHHPCVKSKNPRNRAKQAYWGHNHLKSSWLVLPVRERGKAIERYGAVSYINVSDRAYTGGRRNNGKPSTHQGATSSDCTRTHYEQSSSSRSLLDKLIFTEQPRYYPAFYEKLIKTTVDTQCNQVVSPVERMHCTTLLPPAAGNFTNMHVLTFLPDASPSLVSLL
jgi:hypothetical protein